MFKNEADLKKIISRLKIDSKPNPAHRESLRRQMLSVFSKTGEQRSPQATVFQTLGRTFIKSPISKLAAAAAIIIVVLVGIHQLGGRFFGGTVTFADVLKQIRTFRPYAYTSTTQYKGKADVTRRMMIISLSCRREVYPDGYVQIFDSSEEPHRMLAIHPDKKLAVEKFYPGRKPGNINVDFLRHMSAFENMPDLLAVEDLGFKQVEGRTAKGFHVPGKYNDWTIWADTQTRLPIRIELVHPQIERKIIMTEFEFDAEFDESLFSMTAPEGYTVKQIVDPTEEDMIEGLRTVAVFLGGEFPSEFELRPLQKILREYIEQNNLSPSKDELHSLGEKLSPATKYFARINSNKDFFKLSYIAGGIELGDANTPILWYTPQGSPNYHVVYGDLSVKEVAPDNLAAELKDTHKMVALDIKLPKPMFIGTPEDTSVPNLEKPLGKLRPPFLAPVGTKNVALGKPVSSSDEEPIWGNLEMITDGDKEAADGSYIELGPFLQHVTIDLEAKYEIYAIVVWHYHKQARVYFDVVAQVADDADFITNVKTLFNNDIDNSAGFGIGKDMHYTETNEGRLIDAKGVQARYVRLYSKGNNSNDLNHYIEVEVYGKEVE